MAIFGDKQDDFYDARLVQNARLHLPNVINGQSSPLFFEAMVEIVRRNVHKGYLTLKRRHIKLSGIKDFLHNYHYGLGIRDIAGFLSACVDIDVEKNRDRNRRVFLDWLRQEDPDSFEFPLHYWEFRRLVIGISKMSTSKDKKFLYLSMLKIIYNTHPEILRFVGVGRKYRSIPEAYYKEGYMDRPKTLTPIKLYRHPTVKEIEELARNLNARLDKLKNRLLIAKLLDIYRINEAVEQYAKGASAWGDDSEL